jgi:hypothetical protein
MKTSTYFFIPLLALSLSACILNTDEKDNKSDKASKENILASESDYIPEDGDQVTSLYTYQLIDEGEIAGSGTYYQNTTFNIINELPQKYGYQHHELGPYIQANHYNNRPGIGLVPTRVKYYSLTPSTELLIEHDLNDHYYSTIEFNESTDTSSDNKDGLMVEGEVITAIQNNKLFDEVTGNEIGYETLKVTLTALNSEEITIQAGTFTAARAKYYAEQTTIINASPEDSSTQIMNGYYWLDSKTSTTLKFSIEGTYTAHNNLERVIGTTASSELVSSSEFKNTLSALNSPKQRSSSELQQNKNISTGDIMVKTRLISKELENRVSITNYSKF